MYSTGDFDETDDTKIIGEGTSSQRADLVSRDQRRARSPEGNASPRDRSAQSRRIFHAWEFADQNDPSGPSSE